MPTSGQDLVTKVKKFRDVTPEHENYPSNTVSELLSTICQFLQQHETSTTNQCTHLVFDKYTDWWCGQKATHMLSIAEHGTLDLLYKYMANCYDLGIPLTLTEKRTTQFRFVQDVEIWGRQDKCLGVEELMGINAPFGRLLGKLLGEVFPSEPFLDCVVFDASGTSKTKGVMKTSLRLVWSKLVVTKDIADQIRDYVVHSFRSTKEDGIAGLEEQIKDVNPDLVKDNQWANVFSDAIYFGRYGVRMPLNDRVSPKPLQHPEKRPLAPYNIVRFNYEEGAVSSVEHICQSPTDLEGGEWLKLGCIRRELGDPVTESYKPPVWKGQRAARSTLDTASTTSRVHQGGDGEGGGVAGRRAGAVKVRTKGGSGEPTQRARPRDAAAVKEEATKTFEREFNGTLEDFRERLEAQVGKEADIVEDNGKIIWSAPGQTGAKVEFNSANKRVYIIGTMNQIRSLLNVISPFVRQVGDSARSEVSTRRSGVGGSEQGSQAGSNYAPSQVYAPSAAYAPSNAYGGSQASRLSMREGGVGVSEPSQRVACRVFEAQSAGELNLQVGDEVTVVHDPDEGDQSNIHRWVYGNKTATGDRGWFPLSHTNQVEPLFQEDAA